MIPFANPRAAYQHYRAELDAALLAALAGGEYILGPQEQAFESEFAAYIGGGFGIGVASGTEALWLALRAVGVGPEDEVITPSLTAGATVAAVVECGARPVFADVREADLNIDPLSAASLLGRRTRAIIAVHLYGNPADLTALAALARENGLILIEDCAQAHGARHAGRPVGSFGELAAWSFYPTKNLGAFGDGGLVTTGRAELAEKVRLLREYGWRERYHSHIHGWNSRLDELQAALLRVRLRHLDEDNRRRREIARAYRAAFGQNLPGPRCADDDVGVEHLFAIRHPDRERLRAELRQAGIGTGVHYPVPCHLQSAYRMFGKGPGSLPITERVVREIFSLPMYPELTDAEVERVIEAVRRVASSS